MIRLAAALLTLAIPLASLAQSYPSKPIRWILGYPPGGGTEFIARNVAQTLGPLLGQQIVIENRPGAAAIVGAEAAARSAPDGYTLFMADNGTFVYHLGIYKQLPYDPNKDFIPVGMISRGYMLLLTGPNGPKTLQELVDAARREPGKLNNASNGSGTAHHLAMEVLKQRAKVDIVNVPFKGTAAVMQEVMSERVTSGFADISAARGALAGGKVRPLAVAAKKRLAGASGRADLRGVGLPRFRGVLLAGPRRSGRHAAGDREPALHRARQDAENPGRPQALHRRRHGSASDHAGGDARPHPARPGLLGAAHQVARHPSRLTTLL